MLSLILTFSFWPVSVYSHSSLTIHIYQGLQPLLAYLILLFLNKNTLRNWYGSQNDIHKNFKKGLSALKKKTKKKEIFLKELKRKRSWNYKQLDLVFLRNDSWYPTVRRLSPASRLHSSSFPAGEWVGFVCHIHSNRGDPGWKKINKMCPFMPHKGRKV